MKAVYWTLVAMLALCAIVVGVDIQQQMVANRTQQDILDQIRQNHSTAVCHAITEDSYITDCDYQNGAWRTK